MSTSRMTTEKPRETLGQTMQPGSLSLTQKRSSRPAEVATAASCPIRTSSRQEPHRQYFDFDFNLDFPCSTACQPSSSPVVPSIACLSFPRLLCCCCFVLLRSTDSHSGLVCSAANDRARLRLKDPKSLTETTPIRCYSFILTLSQSSLCVLCWPGWVLWLLSNGLLHSLVLCRGLVFTVSPAAP